MTIRNDWGCFVEFEFVHPKHKDRVFVRGLYDGSDGSRIDLVSKGTKLAQVKPYDIKFLDAYQEVLEDKGYRLKAIRSEDYKYKNHCPKCHEFCDALDTNWRCPNKKCDFEFKETIKV